MILVLNVRNVMVMFGIGVILVIVKDMQSVKVVEQSIDFLE